MPDCLVIVKNRVFKWRDGHYLVAFVTRPSGEFSVAFVTRLLGESV